MIDSWKDLVNRCLFDLAITIELEIWNNSLTFETLLIIQLNKWNNSNPAFLFLNEVFVFRLPFDYFSNPKILFRVTAQSMEKTIESVVAG